MIRFFTNRQMAAKLNIKLSRWKRWSREFLPPDPLGGLQSGLARQYTVDQAFTVYLGGYLVANLNFSIPEARSILSDLKPQLISLGFLSGADQQRVTAENIADEIEAHTDESPQRADEAIVTLDMEPTTPDVPATWPPPPSAPPRASDPHRSPTSSS